MWQGIVNNAAAALGHPGITGAVRNLHPNVLPKAEPKGIAGYADGGSVDAGPSTPDDNMPDDPTVDPSVTGMASVVDPSAAPGADPRLGVIADAEDALGTAEDTGTMQPQHIAALNKFQGMFGPTALAHLHANVKQGLSMRPRKGRLVVGAGTATSDQVPAVVDHVKKANLSTGEFVMPVDAVHGAGQGDPVLGAQRLNALSTQLAAMKPLAAAKAAVAAAPIMQTAPARSMQPPLNVERVG